MTASATYEDLTSDGLANWTPEHERGDGSGSAVVVGGGVAGLIAAGYLARGGQRVTLFERSSTPGGRAATQLAGGYALNRGAHALYTGGAMSRALRELRVSYEAGVPKHVFAMEGGRFYLAPTTPAGLLGGQLLGLRGTLALLRTLVRLSRLDPRQLGRATVVELLEQSTRPGTLRRLLESLARTAVYSSALDLVSADVFVTQFQQTMKHPIHYVHGGWQTLVDGLYRQAAAAGVRVETGTRVEHVLVSGGQVMGVRTRDGHTVAAPTVVVATPPQDAAALVGNGAPAVTHAIDGLVPGHVACLDVALRSLPHTERPVVFDLSGPRFMTAQSRYARVAPEGAAVIHTMKQLDPRMPTDAGEDESDLEVFLDVAQPGWREALVRRVSLPRIAAVAALPLARTGGMAGRPRPAVEGVDGLYLAGDWIGAEGFLADASAASAREAARLALARAGAAR